jgi:starch-binding outer membrane protein, SusD/RagB family
MLVAIQKPGWLLLELILRFKYFNYSEYMKTKINKYIALALLFGFTFSCSEDFLDVKPIATENEAAFYLTMDDAEQAITAVYSQLSYMTTWDRQIQMILGSISSDDAEAGGEGYDDVTEFQEINRLTHRASSEVLKNPYGILFKSIFLANKAIDKLPLIKDLDPKANKNLLDIRVGEAKFLRALNYLQLTMVWGEVPFVDHLLGASEYEMGRAPLRKLYDLMEKDLNDAINILPATQSEPGRATKGAAQALLAKVYLYESSYARLFNSDANYSGDKRFENLSERWGAVLSNAEAVITSGNYELMGFDGTRYPSWRGNVDGFRYYFTTSGENCKEAIFEVQNIADGKGWLVTRGSSFVWWSSARYVYNAAGSKVGANYWGFNVPSPDLANEFEVGDPRFNTTIHKPGAGFNDSINLNLGWMKICYTNTVTGMYQAKFECSYSEYIKNNATWSASPYNIRILRYAEVVLMAAEAAVMLNDNAKALTYINMIKTRARMCGAPGNTVPADISGTVTLDQVKHERRVELALEGQRFFDLVRWGDAINKLNGFLLMDGSPLEFIKGKHEFFPIPQREIDLSRGKLTQYPGW